MPASARSPFKSVPNGLECHTVFFLGLDHQQWRARARDSIESTSTFLVGLQKVTLLVADPRPSPAFPGPAHTPAGPHRGVLHDA